MSSTLQDGYNQVGNVNICLVNPKNVMMDAEVSNDLDEALKGYGGYFTTRMNDRQDCMDFAIRSQVPSLFTTRHNIKSSDVVFIDKRVWDLLDVKDRSIVIDHIKLAYELISCADYLRVTADMRTMGPRRSQKVDAELVNIHSFSIMRGFISRYCGSLVRVYYKDLGWWGRIKKASTLATLGDFGARRDFIYTCKDLQKRS